MPDTLHRSGGYLFPENTLQSEAPADIFHTPLQKALILHPLLHCASKSSPDMLQIFYSIPKSQFFHSAQHDCVPKYLPAVFPAERPDPEPPVHVSDDLLSRHFQSEQHTVLFCALPCKYPSVDVLFSKDIPYFSDWLILPLCDWSDNNVPDHDAHWCSRLSSPPARNNNADENRHDSVHLSDNMVKSARSYKVAPSFPDRASYLS